MQCSRPHMPTIVLTEHLVASSSSLLSLPSSTESGNGRGRRQTRTKQGKGQTDGLTVCVTVGWSASEVSFLVCVWLSFTNIRHDRRTELREQQCQRDKNGEHEETASAGTHYRLVGACRVQDLPGMIFYETGPESERKIITWTVSPRNEVRRM